MHLSLWERSRSQPRVRVCIVASYDMISCKNSTNNPLPALRGRPLPEGEVKLNGAVQLRNRRRCFDRFDEGDHVGNVLPLEILLKTHRHQR